MRLLAWCWLFWRYRDAVRRGLLLARIHHLLRDTGPYLASIEWEWVPR